MNKTGKTVILLKFFVLPFVISSFFAATLCAQPIDATGGCKVVAHRGKAYMYPENSLSGFSKVLEYGVDYVEVDVRTTADSVLMVFHDGNLKRTTRSTGLLKEMRYAELHQVVLKRRCKGPKDERIPTLEQVCESVYDHNLNHAKQVNLYVDCKEVEPKALITMLQRYRLAESAVFYGSDDYLKALKRVFPQARIIPSLKQLTDLDEKITSLEPYGFDVNWRLLDALTVKAIHAKEVKIFTDVLFIFDHTANYRKAERWGVDAIQTDRSRKARRVLGRL